MRGSFGALLFVGAMLTGCAGSAPRSDTLPGVPAATPGGQPQYGGTFYLTTNTAPNSQHPHSDPTLGNFITNAPIYETLVKYDWSGDYRDQYKILPWLAEKWERTDPVTYLFHLRKGVKFHDGSDMTAADVVWSLEYLRDPANRFRFSALLVDLDKISADDPYTIRMTTKGPSAAFLDNLADRYVVVLSKQAFDKGMNLEKESNGTGGFKIQTWDRQKGATLVKNPQYWTPGRPYLDKIQFFYGFDAAAAIAAFAARKNDVVKVGDKAQYDAIKATSPDAVGESFPQTISDHVFPKVDVPPFNDPRVRKAMHLAIDRGEMLSTLSYGLGTLNPPGMNGARKGGWSIAQEELKQLPGYRLPKDADLAEARRLLAEAGHAGGLKATMMYDAGFTRYPGEAQMVVSHLAKVGIQLTLDPRETATAQKAIRDGDYAMTFAQFQYPAETDWSSLLHSKGSQAKSGIKDPELDRLIEQPYRELDVEKRKQNWIAVQRYLLDKLYVIPLITQVGFLATQPYVHGWGDNRAGQAVNQSFESTWFDTGKAPSER
ncbi:MAG: ABC transporter substrate-binding protein [Dehalococcoidia bacterium]|nr:ABC transporter substrate-binding protein [Dehalococcoidia bacterium]